MKSIKTFGITYELCSQESDEEIQTDVSKERGINPVDSFYEIRPVEPKTEAHTRNEGAARFNAGHDQLGVRRYFRKSPTLSNCTELKDSEVKKQSPVSISGLTAPTSTPISVPPPAQNASGTPIQPTHTRVEVFSLSTSIDQSEYDRFCESPRTFKLIGRCSIDEGIASFDYDPELVISAMELYSDNSRTSRQNSHPSSSRLERVDSVMERSFRHMLARHSEHSGGYFGFRRRVANDVNHKYFSHCGCDDVIFPFLYILFGIVYICAGVLGVVNCTRERLINYYLICDGVLSVFLFPITIVEWTKRIGGCIQDNEILDRGIFFYMSTISRFAAAVTGTFIMALRLEEGPQYDDPKATCIIVFTLLEVGVALEWAFIFFGILMPFCVYMLAYIVAKTFAKTYNYARENPVFQHTSRERTPNTQSSELTSRERIHNHVSAL